jgi:hypothetical protein
LVIESTLFSLEIPPPKAVPDELGALLLMKESVIVTLPEVVAIPPPSAAA